MTQWSFVSAVDTLYFSYILGQWAAGKGLGIDEIFVIGQIMGLNQGVH